MDTLSQPNAQLFEFPWECSTGHMPNYCQIHLRYSHPHELQLPCRARVTSDPYTATTKSLIMHKLPARTNHTFRKEGDRHSPAARISYSDAPDPHATTLAHLTRNKRPNAPLSCKSRACPLLRSCVRYAIAFGTFSSSRIFLKFARAAAGVTPLNNNVPSGIFPINGARWCTGQKALGHKSKTCSHHATGHTQLTTLLHALLHQHPLLSTLPHLLFFLQRNKTCIKPITHSHRRAH